MSKLNGLFTRHHHVTVAGVPDGLDMLVVGDIARGLRATPDGRPSLIHVLRDGTRLREVMQALAFFAPDVEVIDFPAWDCQPYDRVSPNAVVAARRMATLARLARPQVTGRPLILLTTVNAILQRIPARSHVAGEAFSAAPGNRIDMADLQNWLETNGFSRTSTVRDQGDYAVRGGIVDLFAPGADAPVRLDFFGDTLESIRTFDAETQRSTGTVPRLEWMAMSEVSLNPEVVARFRRNYVARFGATTREDALYAAISDQRRYAGMEHWLPLFHERLETLFDYCPAAPLTMDPHVDEAVAARLAQIEDYYQARREGQDQPTAGTVPYKPVEPAALYLSAEDWKSRTVDVRTARITRFALPETGASVVDMGGRQGRSFAAERAAGDVNVFESVVTWLAGIRQEKRRILVVAASEGSLDRLMQVLADHHLGGTHRIGRFPELFALKHGQIAFGVLAIETGAEMDDLVVIGEQDILGDRLIRQTKKRAKASNFLTEVAGLEEGDLVVHVDHGIGRFTGLKTITAAGAPHDCLELVYAGGDKLYVPVENIELLTRYGEGAEGDGQLDRLGGPAWQARKAKMRKRIRQIADGLIKTAAARLLRPAPVLTAPDGLTDEFVARFPYEETDDQMAAIEAVHDDLQAGRPMDRLICGDVGFGKTEVALRAAFTVAAAGKQVAVVVPTTLLSRQHFRSFVDRFKGMPIRIAQASRLVAAPELKAAKAELEAGTCDIVVGTHALLSKDIKFRDLGLLIIDEEQHFGVKHKERLKELKAEVHVLTLSATPIPRTLQLALTGVRELSLIATPPIDRMAVRTFVSPFDPLVVREALLREHYRGGQSFYVCPRVSDLAERREFLEKVVPEVKVAVAHGQMAPTELEDVMNAFYEGKYDVLLSTTIVESGLDIPTANTLIIHRADMFGLAQLYQLRGRVGRSKLRAYALLTVPAERPITAQAERRLKVLQSLDSLGAGFQLASHDLDIRGAGNLLGDEQSGHIKEIGFELYQQMLEEAVALLKTGSEDVPEEKWSPTINVGTPVLIPDHYVADLPLRLSLYRRLAELETPEDIDRFAAEMIDRFGPLPDEVEHLLKIVFVKQLCLAAHVEKVEAGPKGAVLSFRGGQFANPPGLIRYIAEQGSLAKIRPDQKIVLTRDWDKPLDRLKGVAVIMTQLAKIAQSAGEGTVDAAQMARATGQAPAAAAGQARAGSSAGQGRAADKAMPQKLNLTPTPPPPKPPSPTPRGRYPSLSSMGRSGPRKWVK